MLLSAAILLPLQAFGDSEDESLRLGLQNNNQVFTSERIAEIGGTFTLSVSGGTKAEVQLELVDIFADGDGRRRVLPLNSNPYTANGLVIFPESLEDYVADGTRQTISVPFKFTNLAEVNRPVMGGLKISLVQSSDDTGQSIVNPSIVATFAYLPKGELAYDFNPKMQISGVSVESSTSDSFPWSLIPNLPNVFSSSNLSVKATIKNAGDVFLNAKSELTLTPGNIFGQPVGEPIASTDSAEVLLLPGQTHESILTLGQLTAGSQSSEPLPAFGVFLLKVEVTGEIDSLNLASTSDSKVILIFPWKPIAVVSFILFLIRKRVAAAYQSLIRRIKIGALIARTPDQESTAPEVVRTKQLDSRPEVILKIKPTTKSNTPATQPKQPANSGHLPRQIYRQGVGAKSAGKLIGSNSKKTSSVAKNNVDRDLEFQQWREASLNSLRSIEEALQFPSASTPKPKKSRQVKNKANTRKSTTKPATKVKSQAKAKSPNNRKTKASVKVKKKASKPSQ